MKNSKNILLALTVVGGCAVQATQAGTILEPVSASTSMGSYNSQWLPEFAINQSGMSVGYVTGVTDFDAYTASATSTNAGASSFGAWFSANGITTGTFDFNLGGANTIESLALWNDRQTAGQGVATFSLLASNDANFLTSTLLGNYSAAEGLSAAQIFSFAPTTAAYVRMVILTNHGSTITGISEAAFEVSEVPLPAAGWAFASGLMGLTGIARRRVSRNSNS